MTSPTSLTVSSKSDRLPIGPLLALAMTGFICIVTETLPAGLLPKISEGLGITTALAGQTVTAYALGSVLAAIPLTLATQHWRRRSVLLLTIIGFLLFNSITAISSDYSLTLVARFFAGAAAGLGWSLIAGYARRMVRPAQQGKAVAIAMVGTPIALSLGVPLGTWLGSLMGWRTAFGAMSALIVLLLLWVIAKMPDYPGQSGVKRIPLSKVFGTPGVRPILVTVLAWMSAHNILYTYVAPFAEHAHMGHRVEVLLLIFGVFALLGIGFTGKLVERHLRSTVLVSIATFFMISVVLAVFQTIQPVVYLCIALWGLTFGGAGTLMATALADSAKDGADVALSMNVVAWNLAIAGGGVLGGVLLEQWGPQTFPAAMAVLLAFGFLTAWAARHHGFTKGTRSPVAGH